MAATFASLHRLQRQPLLISENLGRSILQALHEPQATGRRAVHLFTTTILLLTPMALSLWPLLRRVRRRTILLVLALALAEIVSLGLFRKASRAPPSRRP